MKLLRGLKCRSLWSESPWYPVRARCGFGVRSLSNSLSGAVLDKNSSRDAFIVSVARTPQGSFGGLLQSVSAVDLASISIKSAVDRSRINSADIQEVILGNVISANLGQAPVRQAALKAGLSVSTRCTSVNNVCSSGLKAVCYGADAIRLGYSDAVVVGGMESMSRAPYYVERPLEKKSDEEILRNAKLIDGLGFDGLRDPYSNCAMGVLAEKIAEKYHISREEQDNHATRSYSLAARAQSLGNFNSELIAVRQSHTEKGVRIIGESLNELSEDTESLKTLLSSDEEIKNFLRVDRLAHLPPVFKEGNGTVTAGNSSPRSDGAAALILASGDFVHKHNLSPIARIASHADISLTPELYPIASAHSIPVALERASLSSKDVDYYEISEAFSATSLVINRLLDLNPAHVNIYGGSVALGHPIGSSGARILVTLTSVLHRTSGSVGVAAISNGGGGSTAMVIERV